MESEPAVIVERRGRVGVITLNRPAKLNALNTALIDGLEAGVRELDADEEIGAIVLIGAGERAFSAGGDMAEQIADIESGAPGRQGAATVAVRECRTPILAAIRGYCYGGGALLASCCDIRIGATDARFKFHGASYGRAPGGATLPRIVGDAKAKELLFTGDEVRAEEALRIGLLNQLVAPEELFDTAVGMAERIAANSPSAVRALKETIDRALPIDAALAHEAEVNRGLGRSTDSTARFKKAAEKVIGSR